MRTVNSFVYGDGFYAVPLKIMGARDVNEVLMIVAHNLREDNKEELLETHGDVWEALCNSVDNSDSVYVICSEASNAVCAIAGFSVCACDINGDYCPTGPTNSYPVMTWFLVTNSFKSIARPFSKFVKTHFNEIMPIGKYFYNYIPKHFKVAIRFVEFLGFEVFEDNSPFVTVIKET